MLSEQLEISCYVHSVGFCMLFLLLILFSVYNSYNCGQFSLFCIRYSTLLLPCAAINVVFLLIYRLQGKLGCIG